MTYEEQAATVGAAADIEIESLTLENEAQSRRIAELEEALAGCDPTTPPPSTAKLMVSWSPQRTSPQTLDGNIVGGQVYVFLHTETEIPGPVVFSLDGIPMRTENNAPWDFAGGSVDAANPWDTTRVDQGGRTITAEFDGQTVTAGFVVSNVTVPPPPPPPPPTDGSPAAPPNMATYPKMSEWPSSARIVDADRNQIEDALADRAEHILIRPGKVDGFSLVGKMHDRLKTFAALDGPLSVTFDGKRSPNPFVAANNSNGRGGFVSGVRLLGVNVEEYCWREWSHGEPGTIYTYGGGNNWEVGWCRVARSLTSLLRWGSGWNVHDTVLSQSREFNMAGGGIPGRKTMERVVWEYCGGRWPDGTQGISDTDRGGSKFAVADNIHISDFEVRHSDWNGIWWDIASLNYGLDRVGHSLRNFYIHDCGSSGVFFEVMWGPLHMENGLIRNVAQRGKRKTEGAGWPVGAGVLISNSGPVYGKNIRVETAYNGITCIQNAHGQVKAYDYPDGTKTKKYNLTQEQAREMQAKYGISGVLFEDCHVRDLKTTAETTYGEVPMAFGYAGSNHGYSAEADVEYINCTYDSGQLGNGKMTNVRKV